MPRAIEHFLKCVPSRRLLKITNAISLENEAVNTITHYQRLPVLNSILGVLKVLPLESDITFEDVYPAAPPQKEDLEMQSCKKVTVGQREGCSPGFPIAPSGKRESRWRRGSSLEKLSGGACASLGVRTSHSSLPPPHCGASHHPDCSSPAVSGQPVSLKNISTDTSGYYICTASNEMGRASCNITVAVRLLFLDHGWAHPKTMPSMERYQKLAAAAPLAGRSTGASFEAREVQLLCPLAASMNVALYVGIAVGVVAALIIIGIIIYCCCCRGKDDTDEKARP
ncbi:hypothetical protein P7K49_037756 [Saguinus oedipus]|uniref:Ig-like domain-containing protein n=1 Tax=Saguinus oedipus TaxID=9490 RepID=A0ABQ9TIZ9_SAGOE|nr:hypothetical protein P7K49_037756 [Saguinus oedipus]